MVAEAVGDAPEEPFQSTSSTAFSFRDPAGDKMTLTEFFTNDWIEAFDDAGTTSLRENIVEIIRSAKGDGTWLGIFKLDSGKFLFVTAWAEWTYNGGEHHICDTIEEIARMHCTEEDREQLGLQINDPVLITQNL